MPTRMATCCREKAVLVTVYVERPRRRRVLLKQHHHHHHLHLPIKQEVIQHKHGVAAGHGRGYDRRAELLNYSHHLRESAQPKPISSNNQQQPTSKIIAVRSKPKYARVPTCLGNWKVVIPNFLRSLTSLQAKKDRKKKKKKNSGSTSKKIKAVIKSLEVQKKWGFVSKMFATLQKHR